MAEKLVYQAIDVHCHVSTAENIERTVKRYIEAMEKYYRIKTPSKSREEMAEDFRKARILALPVAWDAETATGDPPLTNDYVANLVKDFPEVFIYGWGSVDPLKGKKAIQEIKRIFESDLREYIIGIKFQPGVQGFRINDENVAYPIFGLLEDLNVPVQIHTGTTGMGAGTPGGMGIKLKCYRPLDLDDVAADFPNLKIIASHPSWPWQDEMIAVLRHKANVYNELSGWSPKYFEESLKREINFMLPDKFMFGTDYPTIVPERWIRDFRSDPMYKEEVVEKVLYKNAIRILGLKDRLKELEDKTGQKYLPDGI